MTFQEINLTDTNQIQLFDKVTQQRYILNIFRTTHKKQLVNDIHLYITNENKPSKSLYKTDYILKELNAKKRQKKNDKRR